jgi:alpha-L-fucosidase
MKSLYKFILAAAMLVAASYGVHAQEYVPSEANLKAREEFRDNSFGIFIHWGIYSMTAQGEWYMQNKNIHYKEYEKLASGFYPSKFDAKQWVSSIKAAGAKYICITSRHHDGFSMFHTKQSDFNIVDATPFKRDIIKELADECHKQGIKLHFYYSHLDWRRHDYPLGNTGHRTRPDKKGDDWPSYYKFMNNQLTELLTNYGPIGAIWFDGFWDHDKNFDWQYEEQYALIHKLQPSCLVGNNHHRDPYPGEDLQIFEKDLPGENSSGFSQGAGVSRLPLETCETMNGMWGYKIEDQNYKSAKEIIHLLVRAAGKNANLLMNIGPQPNGELPQTALDRLKEVGAWLNENGETIYGTRVDKVINKPWGTTTTKAGKTYVHVLKQTDPVIYIENIGKIKSAKVFKTGEKIKFTQDSDNLILHIGQIPDTIDHIIELSKK